MFKKNPPQELNGALLAGATIIAAGTSLKGDVQSKNALRIDGVITGNLHCVDKVIIGPEGLVTGDIHARQVILMGTVKGHITVEDSLSLKGKARLDGNIRARILSVDTDAVFNGSCNMDGVSGMDSTPAEEPVNHLAEAQKPRNGKRVKELQTENQI